LSLRSYLYRADFVKDRDRWELQICNVCHLLKDDFIDFEINQTDAKGRKTTRPSCRDCRARIDGDNFIPSENRKLEAIKPKYLCSLV
jgi:hypothetical protein